MDKFHDRSNAQIEFVIDGKSETAILRWNSKPQITTMKEGTDIANFGELLWLGL